MAKVYTEQYNKFGELIASAYGHVMNFNSLNSAQTPYSVPEQATTSWSSLLDDGSKPSDGASNNWSDMIDDNGYQPANNADVTADNNNWSEITDDDSNKPANNATANTGALADLNSVDTAQIVNAAVEEAKLGNYSVTTNKIKADAVTATKINVVGLNGSSGRIIVADATDANVVTGGINTYAATLIGAGKILISGATTLADWKNGTDQTKIDGGEIYTDTVTATQINVATLSAISADIGTVTSGTITGATIQTSASANTGVKMSTNSINIYGNSLKFYSTGGVLQSSIWGSNGSLIYSEGNFHVITNGGANSGNIQLGCATIGMQATFVPINTGLCHIGTSSKEFGNAFFTGTVQTDALRIDQTPTSGTITPSHYFTISLNGTSYKVACDAA